MCSSDLENPDLMSRLMGNDVPIIPRINKNNIIIDLRSTSEKNDIYIKDFFRSEEHTSELQSHS